MNAQSKSARRRQQLLRRGQRLAGANPAPQQPNQQQSKRKSRRRRNRRPKGLPGFNLRGLSNVTDPYLASLMDPESNTNARVPDMTAVPTSVVQARYDTVLTTTSVGVAGVYINPHLYSNPINILGSTSTDAAYAWNTGVAFNNANQYNAIYSQCRPVSGVIYADYIGTSTGDSGTATGCWQPRASSLPTSTTDAQNRYTAETAPLKLGCKVLWRPMDNMDLEFLPTNATGTRPLFGITFSGAAVSSAVLRIRVFVNFECIPYSDTFDVAQPSPSPIDLGALGKAFEWGQATVDKVTTLLPYAETIATVGMNAANWYLGNDLYKKTMMPRLTM